MALVSMGRHRRGIGILGRKVHQEFDSVVSFVPRSPAIRPEEIALGASISLSPISGFTFWSCAVRLAVTSNRRNKPRSHRSRIIQSTDRLLAHIERTLQISLALAVFLNRRNVNFCEKNAGDCLFSADVTLKNHRSMSPVPAISFNGNVTHTGRGKRRSNPSTLEWGHTTG